MRILLDYLPGSGGDALAEAIRGSVDHSFHADRNEDVRRFIEMEETDRKRFNLVYGRLASRLIDHVSQKTTRVYFACHPSRRVTQHIKQSAANSRAFLYPIANKLPPWQIAHKFPELQNAMAKSFDPDAYDIIATSPSQLLRSLGVRARIGETVLEADERINEVNQADVGLFDWIKDRCGSTGIYFRNRTWHESEAAIVTAHFNPAYSSQLVENYKRWKATISHPVTCYEVVPDGDARSIEGSVMVAGGPENEVWQKERLINLAIANLPIHVRYVAWVDHDLIFGNPNWLADSVNKLRSGYDAIQLFSTVNYLDKAGATISVGSGAVYQQNNGGTNPGGAWIANRKFVDSIGGLYDRSIVGGGDAIWMAGLSGNRRGFESRHSEVFLNHIRTWYGRVQGAKIGYLPGEVFHLWHGDKANRQYISRDETMAKLGYDPERHIEVDRSGLLAWTSEASDEMKAAVRQYFADRRDDE